MDLKIKVIPKSKNTGFAGEMDDGTMKVKVAAVPENGKANQELCTFLAKQYGVPQSHVTVLRGAAAQRKTVRILEK